MDAIKPGLIGAAVEDVQQRLINLGASISDDERIAQSFDWARKADMAFSFALS